MKKLFLLLMIFLSISVYGACSTAYQKAFINEFNTKDNFVELYAIGTAPSGTYSIKVCNSEECVSQTYSVNGSSSWYIKDFSNIANNNNFDLTLYGPDGNVADYIYVGNPPTVYNTDYQQCPSIDTSSLTHKITRSNFGQREFYRSTDGSENWIETTHNNNITKNTSNAGLSGPQTLYVDDDKVQCPNATYTTIASAVSAATVGSTILVCAGNYPQNVTVDKNTLTITSLSGTNNDVIVNLSSSSNMFKINNASGVTLKNMTIQQTSSSSSRALYGVNADSLTLDNLIINYQNGSNTAIKLENGSITPVFKNLKVTSEKTAISLDGSNGFLITDSNISAGSSDTVTFPINWSTFLGSFFDGWGSGNYYGIQTTNINTESTIARVNVISSDTAITHNGAKLWLKDIAAASANDHAIYVTNNTLSLTTEQWGKNILLAKNLAIKADNAGAFTVKNTEASSSSDTVMNFNNTNGNYIFTDNNITGDNSSGYGVRIVGGGSSSLILRNIIKNVTNGKGLRLENNSDFTTKIGQNCFLNNEGHNARVSSNGDSQFNGNFWGKIDGTQVTPDYTDTAARTSCGLIPSLSPIADYRLDECSWKGMSGEVKDSSGNNLNGTANNLATTGIGKLNNAGDFNASLKQNVSILPNNTFKITSAITFTAWIKRDSIDNRLQNIYTHGQWNNALRIQDDNKALFSLQLGGTSQNLYSTQTISDTNWHHITGTYDGSTMKIYIDGVEKGSLSISGIIGTNNAFYTIGNEQITTSYDFNGSIDEVKIFDKALSQAQVTGIYTNELVGNNYDGTSRTASCCCLPTGGNLIANPSFEMLCGTSIVQTFGNEAGGTVNMRNNVCGWTMNGNGMETWEDTTLKPASNGTIFVEIDGYTTTVDQLSQILNTVSGTHYVISFDYRGRNGDSDRIIAKWNGIATGTFTGITTGWQTAQIEVVGTGSDTLAFEEPSADNNSFGSWIDNIQVAVGTLQTTTQYAFDAWDSFRSLSDRNISTKIVNKPFTLTITALNEANTAFQDFNGTVCAKIINNADQNISGWNKLLFNDQNSSTTTFTINRAIGGSDSARVALMWKKDAPIATACNTLTDTNSSVASDRFAVRPASFGLFTTNAVAGTDFYVDFIGYNYNGSASADYNETSGGTFDVSTAEHNAACPLGTFTIPLTPFSFQDGIKSIMTRYSDVGIIDINITDLTKPCTSRFAKIDCDDLNVSDGTNYTANLIPIGLEEGTITITPHHFDVNATLSNFNKGTFTYLSNDLNMSAHLDLNITAKAADGNITKNYNSGCYAKNTNYTINYTAPAITPLTNLTKLNFYETNTSTSANVLTTANSFALTNLPKTIFGSDTNGTATLSVKINFDRNETNLVNPFDLNITSAIATDENSVTGSDTTNIGTAKFVYGRIHAYDIQTDQNTSVPNPVEIEVYSNDSANPFISDKPQNVLKWYRNTEHNTTVAGNVIHGGFNAGENNNSIIPSSTITNGIQNINVTSSTTQTIHLKINPWLWYSQSGKAYDHSNGTKCTQHPCFQYQYIKSLTGTDTLTPTTTLPSKGVNSGTFTGSDFGITAPAKTIKKGIKVFR